MRKISIFILVMFSAFPLFSFSCFGISEGFTKDQIQESGAKLVQISKDYGTYQVWEFEPTPMNKWRDFDYYYAYIDEKIGTFRVIACTKLLGTDDNAEAEQNQIFLKAKWDYAEKYGISKEDAAEETVMLTIGEYLDEHIELLGFLSADSLFLEDTLYYGNPDYVVAAIYTGKSYYDAVDIYYANQKNVI